MNIACLAPPLRRCLIVEGDFLTLCSLRETLTASGFEAHCAAGPGEAGRLIARHSYHLVIVDLGSVTDHRAGLEVIGRVRDTNPGARIVALDGDGRCVPAQALEALGVEICPASRESLDRLRVQIAAVVGTTGDSRTPEETEPC